MVINNEKILAYTTCILLLAVMIPEYGSAAHLREETEYRPKWSQIQIHDPSSPMSISLNGPSQVVQGENFLVKLALSSALNAPDTQITLSCGDGLIRRFGPVEWQADISKNTVFELDYDFTGVDLGSWDIIACAKTQGTGEAGYLWFGDKAILVISVVGSDEDKLKTNPQAQSPALFPDGMDTGPDSGGSTALGGGGPQPMDTSEVFTEDFEDGVFPEGLWSVGDLNSNSGYDYWDDRGTGQSPPGKAYNGDWAAYCADEEETGRTSYDDDMNSHMTYGPFSLIGYPIATISYYLWLDLEKDYDFLYLEASSDNTNWDTITTFNDGYDSTKGDPEAGIWGFYTGNLNTYIGDSSVWIRFRFTSDGSQVREGAYLDDISVTMSTPGDVTVQGKFTYYNDNINSYEPFRLATVQLWDNDTSSGDDFLTSSTTDANGDYSLGPVSNSDDEGGTQDIYVVVFTQTAAVDVKTHSNEIFYWTTPTVNDVDDGTYNYGTRWPETSVGAVHIYDVIIDGNQFVDVYASTPPKVVIHWEENYDAGGSYYSPATKEITINGGPSDPDEWDVSVILHEYGHFIFDEYTPYSAPGGYHTWDGHYSPELAWSEGWADFFQSAAKDYWGYSNPHLYEESYWAVSLETTWHDPAQGPWDDAESTIAGILWDIYDSPADDQNGDGIGDTIHEQFEEIWNVFDNYNNGDIYFTIHDFWNGWFAYGYGYSHPMWENYWEHGINKDTNPPDNPDSYSSSHIVDEVSTDTTIYVEWYGASDDLSGVYGYGLLWSTSLGLPTEDVNTTNNYHTSASLSDGSWYLNIRTVDVAGNWNGEYYSVGPFLIDTTSPTYSNEMPVEGTFDDANQGNLVLQIDWTDSVSGIIEAGFRYKFDSDTWSNWASPSGYSGNTYWYDIPRSIWIDYFGTTLYWESYGTNEVDMTSYTITLNGPDIVDDDPDGPSIGFFASNQNVNDSDPTDYFIQASISDYSGLTSVQFRYKFGSGMWSDWYDSSGSSDTTFWYYIPRAIWVDHVGESIYWQVYSLDNDNDRADDQASSTCPEQLGGLISDDDTDYPEVTDFTDYGNIFDSNLTDYSLSVTASDTSGWNLSIEYYYLNEPSVIYNRYVVTTASLTVTLTVTIPRTEWMAHMDETLYWRYNCIDEDDDRSGDGQGSGWGSWIVGGEIRDDDPDAPLSSNIDTGTIYDSETDDFRIKVNWTDYSGISTVKIRYKYDDEAFTNWLDYSGHVNDEYYLDIPRTQWITNVGKTIHFESYATDSDNDRTGDEKTKYSPTYTAGTIYDDDDDPPESSAHGDMEDWDYLLWVDAKDPSGWILQIQYYYSNEPSTNYELTNSTVSTSFSKLTVTIFWSELVQHIDNTIHWRYKCEDNDDDRNADTSDTGWSDWILGIFIEDEIAPISEHSIDGRLGNDNWYISDVTISLSASDGIGSGIDYIEYRIDGDNWQKYTHSFKVIDDRRHTLEYRSVDKSKNKEEIHRITLKIDQSPPQTTAESSGITGNDNWYNSDVTVSLSRSDTPGSGINYTKFRIDGGEWRTYESPFIVSGDKAHTVEFFSTDIACITEGIGKLIVKIDASPPEIEYTSPGPNSENIERSSTIVIRFSSTMNRTSVMEALSFSPDIEGVKVFWSSDNQQLTLTWDEDLKSSTTYKITLGTKAKEATGNSLSEPYSWQFKTKEDTVEDIWWLWFVIGLFIVSIILIILLIRRKSNREKRVEGWGAYVQDQQEHDIYFEADEWNGYEESPERETAKEKVWFVPEDEELPFLEVEVLEEEPVLIPQKKERKRPD
ncbi:MAG: Ig-like domain-containing protein [Methanomassiliicoccales archaeon]|nr:MAG: Ig-like domain-containing protein [Methanomassiliicoccales archaeon]